MAAEVVEARFDMMRLDADIGHAGRDGPANIVHAPRGLHGVAEPAIQALLPKIPCRKAGLGAIAEQSIARASLHRSDDVQRR